MEVVAAAPSTGGVPPFHDHDVREWSRLDSLTGVLERARLETDHWTANTNNSSHKYGKVVDSRARTNADGALQQQARRQLEVFHSQIPGGHLQVIKTQTVSSSRWKSSSSTDPIKGFESLQLTLNPLDLSSQKSKASVGRGGRRPPSRLRPKEEPLKTRVSRLCHQIHEDALKRPFHQQSSDNSSVEIEEIENVTTSSENERVNGHHSLTRTKSTSSEELHLSFEDKATKSIEDLEALEELQNWRRSSKLRRSLQYPKHTLKPNTPKPLDLPTNIGSVRKIREELEKGRRLSTALRGNNVDLEALDQILQSISSSSSLHSETTESTEDSEVKKRNSFVTVETLQEVRGRLRRTSSPSEDIYKAKEEETDDGIVTEDLTNINNKSPQTRVRSYVYGMETMLNKKPILGTGSLESRTKLNNGNTNIRNEDWYNRRKSYGFEQVHNQCEESSPISHKGRIESSTDSGICRSSEIVKNNQEEYPSVKHISSIFDQRHTFNKDSKTTTITIPIVSNSWDPLEKENKRHSIAVDESKYVTNTTENRFRRTSLAINPSILDDVASQNRRLKKVEFCKTEVHFAAESGVVNIVETDEKPPPTNNFRRRRRNSGPIMSTDDFERNGLPVLHFGDSSYEKVLLGVGIDDLTSKINEDIYENIQSNNIACGTVTVNTNYQPLELQDDKKDYFENVKGILKNKPIKPTPYLLGEDHLLNSNSDSDSGKWGIRLKPVPKTDGTFWKSTVTLQSTVYSKPEESEEQPEFQKRLKSLRPINNNHEDLQSVKFVSNVDNKKWALADKIRLNEETQWAENKVYSTKVHFGDDGTTVVENEPYGKNQGWNKDLAVSKDSEQILNKGLVVRIGRDTSKHTICSKTTNSSNTTTTKITIDLNPFPNLSSPIKVPPRAKRSHSFKSTSLILDTIKAKQANNIPQQLEALKKLYEDVHSDSDADKEVQVLMGELDEEDFLLQDESEVSGSWSKMRAFRTISEHVNNNKFGAKIEKVSDDFNETAKKITESSKAYKINLRDTTRKPLTSLKTPSTGDVLNSPSLVGRNNKLETSDFESNKFTSDTKLEQKLSNEVVLRQPKKSEMTYFGVNVSPSPKKKLPETVIRKLSNKPDLLQHTKPDSVKSRVRPKKTSPITVPDEGPLYENVPSVIKSRHGREFDSTILEELTRAADQILQAVNGFTDEDTQNKDEEEESKEERLGTISETKSWTNNTQTKTTKTTIKSKLKATSSTSSIESLSKDRKIKRPIPVKSVPKKTVSEPGNKAATKARRLQRASSREALLQSHGSSSEDLGANLDAPLRKPRQIKKTKAMQLSVSNGIDLQKRAPNPRRKNEETTIKTEETRTKGPVAEIRHKTAVSTIRSTAEKSSRDRSRSRTDDGKKKVSSHTKRGVNSSRSDPKRVVSSKEVSTHRVSTANIKKCQRADGSTRHS